MDNVNNKTSLIRIIMVFEKKWSGSCQIMEPIFNKLQNEFKDLIVRIDIEKNHDLALSLGINNLPALLLIQNGVLYEHLTGIIPYKVLLKKINNLINIKSEEQ